MTQETITQDGEIIVAVPMLPKPKDVNVSDALARVEIGALVATAHEYPRSINKSTQNIMTLATLDEETADDCIYALPRGGKPIEGPSVRFAEIVAQAWGNCRIDAQVVQIDRVNKIVVAEGTFLDLETNMAIRARVQRRISDKNGKLYNDDMIIMTGNAACSIARRNATLAGVPKGIWHKSYGAALRVVSGDMMTLGENRAKALAAFAHYGVKPERVIAALGLSGEADIALNHVATMRGMFSALKNGEATVEEMFPHPAPTGDGKRPPNITDALDSFAGNPAARQAATTPAPAEGPAQPAPAPTAAAPDHAPPAAIANAPAGDDIPDDAEARAVPATPDEYAKYARAVFAEMTDGGKLRTWWNSDSEKEIRKAAGVGAELATTLKNEGAARATALREAAAK